MHGCYRGTAELKWLQETWAAKLALTLTCVVEGDLQACGSVLVDEGMTMDLNNYLRDVADFPKPGIVFKDISPLLACPEALQYAIDQLAGRFADAGVTKVVGIESRGFLFGPGIALKLGCGFVPMRKPGKLPWKTVSRSYELEYGSDTLEMHVDAVAEGDNVLVVDDLLATGGTMAAAVSLCEDCGARVVGAGFVIDLSFLGGAKKLSCPVEALLTF